MIAALHHAPSSHLLPYLVGGLLVVGLVLFVIDRRVGSKNKHADLQASKLPKDQGLRRYTHEKHAPRSTRHLPPGPPVGRHVGSKHIVRMTWEDCACIVAGPRSGKTTSLAIPSVLAAPGACLATSNKPDLPAATRGIRERRGTVYCFDPQQLAGEPPTWWYNPLSVAQTITGARGLAGLFTTATRPLGASVDAFFDGSGEEYLALLLLAAAVDDKPITAVYGWAGNPHRAEQAVAILDAHGHPLAARGVEGVLAQPERQRAGVTSTAARAVSWLADPALAAWVTDQHDGRPKFDPAAFAVSTDTLYSLSREGAGSAGPLTAALTAAVIGEAERVAARSPGGRLPVPLLCVCDEAANTTRIRDLGDLVSHLGGRHIVVQAYLQSWAQGVECWGLSGMRKIWSSSNLRILGSGVSDADFLSDVSQILGDHAAPNTSHSYQAGKRSTTTTIRPERTFDVAALASLPPGKVICLLSGTKPVLLATQSAHEGPHAAEIRESIARYGTPA